MRNLNRKLKQYETSKMHIWRSVNVTERELSHLDVIFDAREILHAALFFFEETIVYLHINNICISNRRTSLRPR